MDTREGELVKIKNVRGQTIVGILERKLPNESTKGAKVGIICHGVQAHKNFSFQPKLAKELYFDTFRFDFRGNGESDFISIDYGNVENEIEDTDTVVKYLEREYGYQLYAIISHSVGNISSYQYATKLRRNIPHLVSISARYHFNSLLRNYKKEYLENFKNDGFAVSEYKLYGQIKRVITTFDSFMKFMSIDMSFVRNLPESTSIFIIHGEDDEFTSPSDAAAFSNIIPNNTLKIITGANHSYTNHSNELVSSIVEYFSNKFQSTRFFERNKFMTNIPRCLDVEGVINFRDLGGYPCENLSKKRVRERFIFRSGDLTGITENGIKILNFLNIKNIFDFRSTFEVQGIGFANILGVNRIHVPIIRDVDHPESEKWTLYPQDYENYSKVCMMILNEGRSGYKVVFNHILDYPMRPFIIHSAVGKERTGVFCMLVLKLCGVNDEIIARECEIINKNIQNEEDNRYESIMLTLHKFKNVYGIVENYLNEYLGFTGQEINQIKNNLITDSNELYLNSVL